MSVHGVCYDNSQSDKCDQDCSQFINGGCDVSDEIMWQAPIAWIDAFVAAGHGEVVVFTLANDRIKKEELVLNDLGY